MDAIDGMMLHVLAVIFVATLVRSAFGFGEALIAVPLLALVIPVQVAAPLAVLLSITVAGVVVAQDWQQIDFRSATSLFLASLPGIPLGLLLLVTAPESIVKAILAIVILGFSGYSLFRRQPAVLNSTKLAWLFGLVGGILGGAYGMNGPPLVIYGTLRRWSPQQFRATLQGYFLPASLVGMAGYWLAGFWGATVTRYYLISLPVALAAIFLGRAINERIDGHRFLRAVHTALILIALVLLTQALLPQ